MFENAKTKVQHTKKQHVYSLDWLRCLAIFALILYHTGMGFNEWGWHIKAPHTSDAFKIWMIPMHDVRMPLLFVISGALTCVSLQRRSSKAYIKSRLVRLGLPILTAVLVVVPPQVWVERVDQGITYENVWAFYATLFNGTTYPVGNLSWHHLWFVTYLLAYCCIAAFVNQFGRPSIFWEQTKRFIFNSLPVRIVLATLPLIAIELWLYPKYPTTHALIGDWATLAYFGTFFWLGYALMQQQNSLVLLAQSRWKLFYVCLFVGSLRWLSVVLSNELLRAVTAPSFAWLTVLTCLAFAYEYLNKPSAFLQYVSRRSFCVYIAHQTWIVLLIFWIPTNTLPIALQFWGVVVASTVLSLLSYELLCGLPGVRVGFGIAPPPRY